MHKDKPKRRFKMAVRLVCPVCLTKIDRFFKKSYKYVEGENLITKSHLKEIAAIERN